jgi:hypothetical protein
VLHSEYEYEAVLSSRTVQCGHPHANHLCSQVSIHNLADHPRTYSKTESSIARSVRWLRYLRDIAE